jgi:hypothetical protein
VQDQRHRLLQLVLPWSAQTGESPLVTRHLLLPLTSTTAAAAVVASVVAAAAAAVVPAAVVQAAVQEGLRCLQRLPAAAATAVASLCPLLQALVLLATLLLLRLRPVLWHGPLAVLVLVNLQQLL